MISIVIFIISVCLELLLILNFNRVVDRVMFEYFGLVYDWENRYRRGRHSRRITERDRNNMWYYVNLANSYKRRKH